LWNLTFQISVHEPKVQIGYQIHTRVQILLYTMVYDYTKHDLFEDDPNSHFFYRPTFVDSVKYSYNRIHKDSCNISCMMWSNTSMHE